MAVLFDNAFFTLQACDNGAGIKLEVSGSNIPPETLDICSDFKEFVAGKTVYVTGKSSCEFYLALGYFLVIYGADRILGIDAFGKEHVHFDASNPYKEKQKMWLDCRLDTPAECRCRILPAPVPTARWTEEQLHLNNPVDFCGGNINCLSVEGRGSVWMYMLIGLSAAIAGVPQIRITKPLLPYDILVFADGSCQYTIREPGNKNGIVLGVLGDPNSGKSVFSRNFALALHASLPSGYTSWIYDCDLASPTSDWFLEDCELGKAQRQALKQKWSGQLEKKAVADLNNLKENLDVVLADMPGGRKLPDGTLDRIPSETRGKMMAACDCFIVLCRQDRSDEIFNAWLTALDKYNLGNRIIARFESSAPEDLFSVTGVGRKSESDFFTASITGLDRKKNRDEIILTMRQAFKPFIDYLLTLKGKI